MSNRPAKNARAPFPPVSSGRKRIVERLESRLLMAADAGQDLSLANFTAGSGLICGCPVCRGMLNTIPDQTATAGGTSNGATIAKSPISSIPTLHSNAAARVKIYLDFNGNFEAR